MDPDSPLSQLTVTEPTPGYWRDVEAHRPINLKRRASSFRTISATALIFSSEPLTRCCKNGPRVWSTLCTELSFVDDEGEGSA